jgi:hypothetical protein
LALVYFCSNSFPSFFGGNLSTEESWRKQAEKLSCRLRRFRKHIANWDLSRDHPHNPWLEFSDHVPLFRVTSNSKSVFVPSRCIRPSLLSVGRFPSEFELEVHFRSIRVLGFFIQRWVLHNRTAGAEWTPDGEGIYPDFPALMDIATNVNWGSNDWFPHYGMPSLTR